MYTICDCSFFRKTDYWLSFIEVNRLPGINPPHVLVIGSHSDLLKKRLNPNHHRSFLSELERYANKRLQDSGLLYSGFFAIDCR